VVKGSDTGAPAVQLEHSDSEEHGNHLTYPVHLPTFLNG
jgi:hypothetical protein